MELDYDVIIVGAGPSGCSAAFDLSDYGISVLLLDKSEFPRAKPCAGGLTIKTLQALRYSIKPVIQNVCYDIKISNGLKKSSLFKSRNPLCVLTERQEFDEYCLNETLKKKVDFKIIEHIKSIEEFENHVAVETNEGFLKSKFIIGADGANSTVRRLTNTFSDVHKGLAIEGQVYLPKEKMPKMEFDFGATKFGYGWIFPKNDHVNVGLYTNNLNFKITKESVRNFLKDKLDKEELTHFNGHIIGLNGSNYKQTTARIFLVGDAAGLVDHLLGEGIYNAIVSGQAAAKAIYDEIKLNKSAKEIYAREIRIIQKDLNTSFQSSNWFYRYPNIGFRIVNLNIVKYFLLKGFAMGKTFGYVKIKFLNLFFTKIKPVRSLDYE